MMADQNQRLWLLNHTAVRFGLEPLNSVGVGVPSVCPSSSVKARPRRADRALLALIGLPSPGYRHAPDRRGDAS